MPPITAVKPEPGLVHFRVTFPIVVVVVIVIETVNGAMRGIDHDNDKR